MPLTRKTGKMNGYHKESNNQHSDEDSSLSADDDVDQLISEDSDAQPSNDQGDQVIEVLNDDQEGDEEEEDEDEEDGNDEEEDDEDDDVDVDDEDEDEEVNGDDNSKRAIEEPGQSDSVKKAKWDNPEEEPLPQDDNTEQVVKNNPRIKLYKNAKDHSKRLIVILEKANLEIVKVGKSSHGLLNCDEHMNLIRKYKKDPAFCRPDIVHQCLLMLFDSPLNRAGLLQVYIHTMNNILIEINPQTRFPRTFKRFASLMVQLLYKSSIKSANGPEFLLRVIKNPVTSHLPVGCRKIGTSFKAEKLIKPSQIIDPKSPDEPIAIVIGAMAHGEASVDYTEETICVSKYPLSGALACTKIVSAFEEAWDIH